MSLPLTDAQGRVYVLAGGTPVSFNAGLGYDASKRLCVTSTVSATDSRIGGIRISAAGLLVVGNGDLAARPYFFNAGLPFDKRNGALIRQVDIAPAVSDPYVAGVRVGVLGGAYVTTSVPP